MSQETDWFQSEYERHERCYWRRIGFILFALLLVLIILAPLAGCATQEQKPEGAWNRVCSARGLGQTEDGATVVLLSCVTIEEFKAAQK